MTEQQTYSEQPPGIVDRTRSKGSSALTIYRRFDFSAKVSTWILFVAVGVAALAPVIAPHDPYAQNYEMLMQPPLSGEYLLGTDPFGRDVLSRLMYGARVSLYVGIGSVVLSVGIGVPAGSIAAWSGGLVDEFIMRCADVVFAFPGLVLALALISALGPSMNNVVLALGIVYSPQYARLIRSTILSVKQEPYVDAAKTTGLDSKWILIKHVIPNSITPVIVQATFLMAWAMLAEAALSFLGLGVQPPTSSWGIIIANGREYMPGGWWVMLFPGLAIMTIVIAFNYVGDALRDELDPYSATDDV